MIRRDFLKTSTLALLAAGVGPVALFSGRPARAEGAYSKARFDALVGHWFSIGDDAHPTLELVRVHAGPESWQYDQFTAVFRAPADAELGDAIHALRSDTGESMTLHLAPSDSDDTSQYLAAQFCVLRPPVTWACYVPVAVPAPATTG